MDRIEQQAAGTHPAPCARHCEANAFQIEIRGLKAAHASAVEAGKKLAQQALKAERERDALRLVCGEAYQMAGALDAPTKALDNLLAASTGAPLPHETFLPALSEESEIEKERDALAAGQKQMGEDLIVIQRIHSEQKARLYGEIAMLKADIKAAQEQKPVARIDDDESFQGPCRHAMAFVPMHRGSPLYAHPVPARELTDAIIGQIYIKAAAHIEHATQREIAFARAIERHLRGDAP